MEMQQHPQHTPLVGPFDARSADVLMSFGRPVHPPVRRTAPAVQVVISHSSKDAAIGRGACEMLESKGLRCWIAPRDILPGEEWGAAIVNAINRAQVMVLIYTAHSNDSPQVRREVERAVARRVVVIPFRVEDVPMSPTLEYFISTPHWLDAMTPPLSHHFDRLAEGIRTMLAADAERSALRPMPTPAPTPTPLPPPRFSNLPPASKPRLQLSIGIGCAIGAAAFAFGWQWRGLPVGASENFSRGARRDRAPRANQWMAGS